MDENLIKIDKLVINVKGKKLELTIEEAKDLKKLLEDLFKVERQEIYIPSNPPTPPNPVEPYTPISPNPYPWYPISPYEPWKITWCGNLQADNTHKYLNTLNCEYRLC